MSRILHLCLGNFYIDNYSYQENILPKYHKLQGHEVKIIASLYTYNKNGEPDYIKESKSYYNENGILVTRINYKKVPFNKKLKIFDNKVLYSEILDFNPHIIFIHNFQFLSLRTIVKYLENNNSKNIKVYVDNHADVTNSARNWLSKNIQHKILWRHYAKIIEPYAIKFYGISTPSVNFLKEIYQITDEKIELLPLGIDDEKVEEVKNPYISKKIREKHNIKSSDFLIMTGGKIDNNKTQTLLLMQAIREMNITNIKLIIFGSIIPELKNKFNKLLDENIIYVGWLNSDDIYKYLNSADLVVFPGLRSVLWIQAIGLGKPCVFNYIGPGITDDVDLGGNCIFLYENTVEEMKTVITEIVNNKNLYEQMKNVASIKGMSTFSYKKIAEKSIRE